MDWTRDLAEIDGCIHRLEEDLQAQVAMEHDALAARDIALGAVESANAIICRCRDSEQADRDEIYELKFERLRIIRQRESSE